MKSSRCASNKDYLALMPVSTSIAELQHRAAKLLGAVGIESPELDARLLLSHALSCSSLELILARDKVISKIEWEIFISFLKRRLCFEPIAYILGVKEFYGHEFIVTPACLIPRPDTEILVEQSLKIIASIKKPVVFDIGTGSGALAITLLKECPHMRVIASDLSHDALEIAQKNAERLGVSTRLELRLGDLFEPFLAQEQAHVIVSNPPYISAEAYELLASDVKNYEPFMALQAPDQGLAFYKKLLTMAQRYLLESGFLIVEVAFDQSEIVAQLAQKSWRNISIHHDLAGHARVVAMQKGGF